MADWTHYRTFLAVMRAGGQSQAARRLGLAQPTVRRHIEALEKSLGRKLFLRSPSGLRPNALARALRPSAEAMEAQAAGIERRAAAGEGPRGTVRISASRVVAAEVLPAILRDLREREPGLRFEVDASDDRRDLLNREADIAVRMTPPSQLDLVQRRVGAVGIGLFAHRSWLERHAAPQDMEALARCGALLGFDRDEAQNQAWAVHLPGLQATSFVLRSDNESVLLQALRAGLGVGACQLPVAARDPDLMRLLPGWEVSLGMWVVTHADLRDEARVAAVFDHLRERLAVYARGEG